MKLAHPETRSQLAAEYVLGTLKGLARRRFEDYLRRDASLRQEVSRWEAHLLPLAEKLPGVEPPARVWQRIESRIAGRTPDRTVAASGSFWSNLAFWRNLGLGASAAVAALVVATLVFKPGPVEPMLTAVLEDNQVARVFIAQPQSNLLNVKMVKPWKAMNGMTLELWVIPKEGAPRSLGLINETGETAIVLVGLDGKLADGALFALSKEPAGGSPTGAPTGAVLCKGAIARIPPKTTPRGQI